MALAGNDGRVAATVQSATGETAKAHDAGKKLPLLMLGALGIANFVHRRNAARTEDATTLSLTPEEEAKLARLAEGTNESNFSPPRQIPSKPS